MRLSVLEEAFLQLNQNIAYMKQLFIFIILSFLFFFAFYIFIYNLELFEHHIVLWF